MEDGRGKTDGRREREPKAYEEDKHSNFLRFVDRGEEEEGPKQ